MKTVIVTGWSTKGYDEYAREITSTWNYNIPRSIHFYAFVDDDFDKPVNDFELRKLSSIPGYNEFIQKYQYDSTANGLLTPDRPGVSDKPYDYRWDVIKWARQAFIVYEIAEKLSCSREPVRLIWFDADVEFFKKLPIDFFDCLMTKGDISYLGRPNLHPDIGFVGYHLPNALDFLTTWKDVYANGTFRNMKEWHSAFTWAETMKYYQEFYDRHYGGKLNFGINLTEGKPLGPEKSIWEASPLSKYCYHLKGTWKFKKTGIIKNDQIERL